MCSESRSIRFLRQSPYDKPFLVVLPFNIHCLLDFLKYKQLLSWLNFLIVLLVGILPNFTPLLFPSNAVSCLSVNSSKMRKVQYLCFWLALHLNHVALLVDHTTHPNGSFQPFGERVFVPFQTCARNDAGVTFGRKLHPNIFVGGCEQRARNSVFWNSIKFNWLESRTKKKRRDHRDIEHLTWQTIRMQHAYINYQTHGWGVKRKIGFLFLWIWIWKKEFSARVYTKTITQYTWILYFLNENTCQ